MLSGVSLNSNYANISYLLVCQHEIIKLYIHKIENIYSCL